EQPHLLLDGERIWAEIPRGSTQPHRPRAGNLLERIGRAQHQVALDLARQHRIQFVYPAMNPDLMSLGNNATLLVLVQQSGDGRDIEAGFDAVTLEDIENPRDTHAIAVLAPAQAAD